MRALWHLLVWLTSVLDSASSGWASIAAAALLTLLLAAFVAVTVCVSIVVWGAFMYVRRWLGWRALWRRRS